jgi:hypothetical protein
VKVPDKKVYSHTNTKIQNDGTVKKKDIYKKTYKTKRVCENENIVEKRPEIRVKYYYEMTEWVDEQNYMITSGNHLQKARFETYQEYCLI